MQQFHAVYVCEGEGIWLGDDDDNFTRQTNKCVFASEKIKMEQLTDGKWNRLSSAKLYVLHSTPNHEDVEEREKKQQQSVVTNCCDKDNFIFIY